MLDCDDAEGELVKHNPPAEASGVDKAKEMSAMQTKADALQQAMKKHEDLCLRTALGEPCNMLMT